MRPSGLSIDALEVHTEYRPALQCPACHRKWPADWEYCQHCATWLPGHECLDPITRLVPNRASDVWSDLSMQTLDGVLLACEVRCHTEQPSHRDIEAGVKLFEQTVVAIEAFGGVTFPVMGAGVAGYWSHGCFAAESAANAAAAILTRVSQTSLPSSLGLGSVSLATAAVAITAKGRLHDGLTLAFHIASLALPNTSLFSSGVYECVVARFDFRGVQLIAPRSESLPPVFQLLGPKPERSGTHYNGPERHPTVGRDELLKVLDGFLPTAGKRQLAVIHLIGEAGLGKSKLLREWLTTRSGDFAGWLQLRSHGVPYGGYPFRVWQRLAAPLGLTEAETSRGSAPPVSEFCERLCSTEHPVLLVVDDLHWADAESKASLAELIVSQPPALVVLAYRPSFASMAPSQPQQVHHYIPLSALRDEEMSTFLEILAHEAGLRLSTGTREQLVARAQGSPLYAEEAMAHFAAVANQGAGESLLRFPASLIELLILRVEWTIDVLLPPLEKLGRQCGACRWAMYEKSEVLRDLENLEEQLSSWLDRFDVIEIGPPEIVARFLKGLGQIDGQLALLSLLLGRQRPHHGRLAQALERIARLNWAGELPS